MKLKYIFAALAGVLLTLAGCNEKYEVENLKGLEVNSSNLSLPQDGGSTTLTIVANDSWQIDTTGTVTKGNAWLNFSSLSGNAGESDVIISADSVKGSRSASFTIYSGSMRQIVNIQQGEVTVTNATVAEVLAGPDAATYRVSGTVTKIANTKYGNFYLNDGTSKTDLYIYGTVDASGSKSNWASFNIEEGDSVTVQGPKSTYKGTVELVDAEFISVVKSLIKVDSTYVGSANSSTLPKNGGEITVYVTSKGNGISATIPDDAKDWLSISSIKGTATGSAITFKAAANTAGTRSTTLTFTTNDGEKDYTANTTITQEGAIAEVSLAGFKAAAVGQTQYRLKVLVTRVDSHGNYYVNDYTDPSGAVEIYKPTGDLASSVKAGDVITVVGNRAEYKNTVELSNPVVENVQSAKSVSLAEFNAAPDGNDLMVITGTVKEINSDKFGNIHVTDGTTDVYVYGVYGYGAPKGEDRQNFLASNGIAVGDKITLVGPKTTYKSTIEMNGGYYVSHTKPSSAKRR